MHRPSPFEKRETAKSDGRNRSTNLSAGEKVRLLNLKPDVATILETIRTFESAL
jgi:hypothetical protein